MPAITSSTILAGPCKIAFDGATFYSEGDVVVKLIEERYKIKVAGFPDLQERTSNRKYEISFKPAGEWRNLSVLFPYGSTNLGAQIFSNEALTIWTRDASDNKHLFSNAAITKMPGILVGVKQTLLGDMTFTALLKDGGVPGDADAYFAVSTDTFPTEALDLSTILTRVVTRAWGSSPWDSFNVTENGIVYDFPMEVLEEKVDGLGTVNMRLVNRAATAKFTPVGITVAQLVTATGSNGVLGAAPTVNDFIVAGTGIHLTLYDAQFRDVNLNFGLTTGRIGEIMAMATTTFDTGALNPLWRIGTAAP